MRRKRVILATTVGFAFGLISMSLMLLLGDRVAVVTLASGQAKRELRISSSSVVAVSFITNWDTWAPQTSGGILRSIEVDPAKWIGMSVTDTQSVAAMTFMTGEFRSGFESVRPGAATYYVASTSALEIPYYCVGFGAVLVGTVFCWIVSGWTSSPTGSQGEQEPGLQSGKNQRANSGIHRIDITNAI